MVSQDERETGVRTLLNYGHTVGHALEAATGYRKILHGEAVAVGMVAAGRLSHRLGLLTEAEVKRQEALLGAYGLPLSCPGVKLAPVLEAMELDKKVRGGEVRWALLKAIGRAVRGRVPGEQVEAVLEELLEG